MTKRLCIENTKTGVTRLAVLWGSLMPSVWKWSDQGSDAWQFKLGQFYQLRLRGGEFYDPPHRAVRNRERSTAQSGGTFIKVEFGIDMGWIRGPWKSEGNRSTLLGAAHEIFANFDYTFFPFQLLYERIARARNKGRLPMGFGTVQHQIDLWMELRGDKLLQEMGESYVPNRWKSWSDRFEWWVPSFDLLLMILLYILVTRGVCKNIEQDFPYLVSFLKGLRAVLGPADGDGEDLDVDVSLKSVKESSKVLEARRSKGLASMLLVAESLSSTTSRKLGMATFKVPLPYEEKMLTGITQRKTQTGTFDFYVGQSCGDQVDVIKKSFALLEDGDFITEVGFLERSEVLGPEALREDRVIADYIFDLMLHCAANEVASASFYRDRPPYSFPQNVIYGIRL